MGQVGQIGPDIRQRVERVKARYRLSDIIGKDINLVKAGREFTGLCPFHADRKIGSFMVNDDKEIYRCFSCGAQGDHFKYLTERTSDDFMAVLRSLESEAGLSFKSAAAQDELDAQRAARKRQEDQDMAKRHKRAIGLWHFASLLKGTPAQAYLEGRGIDFTRIGKIPGALRYRHDVWHPTMKMKLPAMVACMFLAGAHVATHATFIELRNGQWQKLDRIDEVASADAGQVVKHKAKFVYGSPRGAHIPLNKGRCAAPLHRIAEGTNVYDSEGIEDGLSVAMLKPDERVVASYSLGNIGALVLPPQAGDLIIIGQWDERNPDPERRDAVDALEDVIAQQQEQADAHAAQTGNAPRTVRLLMPPKGVKDWNDAVRGGVA